MGVVRGSHIFCLAMLINTLMPATHDSLHYYLHHHETPRRTRRPTTSHERVLRRFASLPAGSIDLAITNRALHNKSDVVFSPRDIFLLSHGMSFVPTPIPASPEVITQKLDLFDRSVRLNWNFRAQSDDGFDIRFHIPVSEWVPPPAHPKIESFLAKVREDVSKALKSTRVPFHKNFRLDDFHRLKKVAGDPHFEFRQADKNLGLTAMTWTDYDRKVKDLLSDTLTYTKVCANKANAMARLFITKCKSVIKSAPRVFTTQVKKFIQSKFEGDWSFPKFYGIPKLHKPGDWKLRPIVPSFSWVTHQLSVWVSSTLNAVVKDLSTCVTSTISLVRSIESKRFPSDCEIGTVDVTALYPSIPIRKGVQIVSNVLRQSSRFSPSTVSVLAVCMLLILQFNIFTYEGQHHHQIKGTAMGSSFAPAFANLFMYGIEFQLASSWRHLFFYKRYIDDIFFVVQRGFSQLFVRLLNRLMEGIIVFTSDIGRDSVPFLDLVIFKGKKFRSSSMFDFKVFQKTTNLYQYIPFQSEHPISTVKGFIRGELTRYCINSSCFKYFSEIRTLFYLRLRARGYPHSLLLAQFKLVSYSIRSSKLSPPPKLDMGKPIFLNLPFDRFTPRLKINRIIRSHWTEALTAIDPFFNPGPPRIVYSKGRSIFDIVRSLQKQARASPP